MHLKRWITGLTALPFLMDQFEIPQDLFELYIPTSIVTGKFDTLVSAMNLLAFSLIGTSALAGYLELKPARILRYPDLRPESLAKGANPHSDVISRRPKAPSSGRSTTRVRAMPGPTQGVLSRISRTCDRSTSASIAASMR